LGESYGSGGKQDRQKSHQVNCDANQPVAREAGRITTYVQKAPSAPDATDISAYRRIPHSSEVHPIGRAIFALVIKPPKR
jgi:hypothetical protein